VSMAKKDTVFRVGLIGAGLQGNRRAPVLRRFKDTALVMVASLHRSQAQALADITGCKEATDRWQDIIERDDINAVLVCTPPDLHAPMSIAAMRAGKHVLCEKPLARTVADAEDMLRVAGESGATLKCGFNHRHHPGVQKARQWVDEGAIGELDFMRCRYGICGRPGYEKEWRADPAVSGGGHLMEQGIHAIDLFRWFLGDFSEAVGFTSTRFWDIKPLEDNGFALLRNARGQIASLHSSLTQWKNIFSLEIFGREGYIIVEGLGGAYGNEKITLGKRDLTAPFRAETTEFLGGDRSWHDEWQEFAAAIAQKREPLGNGRDGLEALKLVQAIYQASAESRVVKLK
jgi:predicted dehydrogenase